MTAAVDHTIAHPGGSGKPPSGGGGSLDLMSLIHEAGFRGQAAIIMYAIVMAESGGDAHAHNTNASTGDNSYGLAQINMLGDLGPARLAEYGLSSNADLFDPLTNLKVAFKMSGGGTHWSDWSTYNTGAYQQFMNQTGAQVTNGGGGSGGSGGDTSGGTATLTDYQAVDSLGKLLGQIPALRHLVDEAQAGDWSVAKFQNAVEDSAWWKNHSQTARAVIIQRANDPASWQQTLTNTESSIAALGRQLGMSLTPEQVAGIARNALLTGNDGNQQWITSAISDKEDYSGAKNLNHLQGGMAATAQQLQQMAADYGFNWTAAQVAQHAQDVLDGTTTIDTYRQRLMSWAESTFPGLAKQIQGGTTVKDLASPYVSSMSNLLEIDPGKLDVYNPMIRQALQGTTPPGSKDGQVSTPLWKFEQQVRQDPRWAQTQNAHDTMSSALVRIGADFGFGPQG